MSQKEELKLFEDRKVRTVWDDLTEEWYFSVVDVCGVLTDSDYQTARKYWKVLKGRLIKEGNELVTNCYQLKMVSPIDGKRYNTDNITNRAIETYPNFLNTFFEDNGANILTPAGVNESKRICENTPSSNAKNIVR